MEGLVDLKMSHIFILEVLAYCGTSIYLTLKLSCQNDGHWMCCHNNSVFTGEGYFVDELHRCHCGGMIKPRVSHVHYAYILALLHIHLLSRDFCAIYNVVVPFQSF